MFKARLTLALALSSFSAYGEIIDQQQNLISHHISVNAFAPVGQSFTPALTQITRITVALSDAGGFGVGNHVHIKIRKNTITGDIIAQSESLFLDDCFNFEQDPGCNLGGGESAPITFTFNDPVQVISGESYVFEIVPEGNGDGLLAGYSNTDELMNGQLIKSGSPQQGDMRFTLYGIGDMHIYASADQRFLQLNGEGLQIASELIPESVSNALARDLVHHPKYGVHFYNGVFQPELSSWHENEWFSQTLAGWSTINNVSYGGLAQYQQWLFATDMQTAQGGEANGLVRFDASFTKMPVRFHTGSNYMDITLGLDQKLYALKNGSGNVDVFDPESLQLLTSLDIGNRSDYRAVTANDAGEIWYVTWGGLVGHYSATGDSTLNLATNLMDIDIHPQFGVLVSGRFGDIWHLDRSLEIKTHVNTGFNNTFVSFAETRPLAEPEPPMPVNYCDASGTNTRYEWIESVAIDGNIFTSAHDNGYYLHEEPIVINGGANAITLEPGFGWSNYNEHWRVWLDANADGEFSNNELLIDSQSASTINTSIMLPPLAEPVTTRMRISMKYGGASEACGSFYFGEVEDIPIIIQP